MNVKLPGDVAAVAGVTLDVPPAEILPSYRTAGDADALGGWLRERAADPATVHLVVSVDMLLYGGLIASRTSDDTTRDVLARLDVLREVRRMRPDLPISAVSLVTRASNSYSAAEEPTYWTEHGKEIHALGGDAHRLLGETEVLPLDDLTPVPAEVVSDYSSRRLRNHIVNLSTLGLLEDETLDFLAITADDTAPFAAGSAEQVWLRHWMRMLPSGRRVLMYPGADEVGAALVARALAANAGVTASFSVACADADGMQRVPPYENMSLAASASRQIRAAGAEEVATGGDVTLVLHAPTPTGTTCSAGGPRSSMRTPSRGRSLSCGSVWTPVSTWPWPTCATRTARTRRSCARSPRPDCSAAWRLSAGGTPPGTRSAASSRWPPPASSVGPRAPSTTAPRGSPC